MKFSRNKRLTDSQMKGIVSRRVALHESLRGDAGDSGEKGPQGDSGSSGLNGVAGKSGMVGESGRDGARGPAGPQGPIGLQGEAIKGDQGEAGEDGRGIVRLQILRMNLVVTYTDGEQVNLGRVVGNQGPKGSKGASGGIISDIGGGTSVVGWGEYSLNVEYTGSDTSIAAGLVKACTYKTATIYRFINGTLNANDYPNEDSFYSDFDGVDLTNLIVTRGS